MAKVQFNKQLFKKWWFWAILVVVIIIGAASGNEQSAPNNEEKSATSNAETVGKLPAVNKTDYLNKEGLLAFKELTSQGYSVTASYVNEKVPAANQELTEQFTSADVTSCQDRLGYDAYLVKELNQQGDTVSLKLTNEANSSQTCPEGTKDDLQQ